MDYHVITHETDELVMQVIDGHLVIVPPPNIDAIKSSSANDRIGVSLIGRKSWLIPAFAERKLNLSV